MVCRTRGLLIAAGLLLAASSARAQDQGPMPNPQAMQMQVQQIAQQRPREAEAADRAYRSANETQRDGIRSQIEKVIVAHFDYENQLRRFEISDIERRLVEVRAETQRRVDKRAEFIRYAVDDIIRDAVRPR